MLRQQLNDSLKEAMRARDSLAVSTLRLILAAVKDRDIGARGRGAAEGVPDEEILSLLQSMIRQRRDSIQLYEQGGRLELARQEQAEIGVIERFLPRQMDEAEARKAVDEAIAETNAAGLKDMGRVMALLRERHAGAMDFSQASAMARAALSA